MRTERPLRTIQIHAFDLVERCDAVDLRIRGPAHDVDGVTERLQLLREVARVDALAPGVGVPAVGEDGDAQRPGFHVDVNRALGRRAGQTG